MKRLLSIYKIPFASIRKIRIKTIARAAVTEFSRLKYPGAQDVRQGTLFGVLSS
jgi:hypothetical protein